MVKMRLKPNKGEEKDAFFTKPENQVIPSNRRDKMNSSKKHKFNSCDYTIRVAQAISWYVNPSIYILFSVAYFIAGLKISK